MAGAYIIGIIALCALLIAANLMRRDERPAHDSGDQFSDCDAHLIKILNNHDRGIRCD